MKNKTVVFMAIIMIFSVFLFGCSDARTEMTSDNGESASNTEQTVQNNEGSAEKNEISQNTAEKETPEQNVISKKDDDNSGSGKTEKKSDKGNTSQKASDNGRSAKSEGGSKSEIKGNTAQNSSSEKKEQSSNNTQTQVKTGDTSNWPDNEYTRLVPKPSHGTVKKIDMQDGIYCILMTGADMVDVKTYAASLINSGYSNEVTETIENNSYLFGGGNAQGHFVVVSYQNGQFIVGIQK